MNYQSLPNDAFGPLIERPFNRPVSDRTIVRAYFKTRKPTTVEAHRIGWNEDRPQPVTGYRVLLWTPEQCATHVPSDPVHTALVTVYAAHLDVVERAARIAGSHGHPDIADKIRALVGK